MNLTSCLDHQRNKVRQFLQYGKKMLFSFCVYVPSLILGFCPRVELGSEHQWIFMFNVGFNVQTEMSWHIMTKKDVFFSPQLLSELFMNKYDNIIISFLIGFLIQYLSWCRLVSSQKCSLFVREIWTETAKIEVPTENPDSDRSLWQLSETCQKGVWLLGARHGHFLTFPPFLFRQIKTV